MKYQVYRQATSLLNESRRYYHFKVPQKPPAKQGLANCRIWHLDRGSEESPEDETMDAILTRTLYILPTAPRA